MDLNACQTCEPGFGLQNGFCDVCLDGTYLSGMNCLGKTIFFQQRMIRLSD